MEELIRSIKRHEGYSDKIYKDNVGVLTCGWGHALLVGSKVPKEVAEVFFEADIAQALKDFRTLSVTHRNLCHMNMNRRRVIVEMLFNLGLTRFRTFKRMLAAIDDENYLKASHEMIDSKWARQVGVRSIELALIMKNGYTDKDMGDLWIS